MCIRDSLNPDPLWLSQNNEYYDLDMLFFIIFVLSNRFLAVIFNSFDHWMRPAAKPSASGRAPLFSPRSFATSPLVLVQKMACCLIGLVWLAKLWHKYQMWSCLFLGTP